MNFYYFCVYVCVHTPVYHPILSFQDPSGFPTNNLYTLRFSSPSHIHATYPAYLILLDLTILIILGQEYKLCILIYFFAK
jgi:hypothetical protein